MKRYLLLFVFLPVWGFAAAFNLGEEYVVIEKPKKQNQAITVTEFFSYGCPWCYKLEPIIEKFKKELPQKVKFERVPVVFEKNWDLYAKAYYTADKLQLNDKLTPALFDAIQNKKEKLNTTNAMIDFFSKHGVDKKTAESAFKHSPTINTMVKNGVILMQKYQIYSVPTIVINGKYKTDLAMTNGNPELLLEVMRFLVQKALQEQQ